MYIQEEILENTLLGNCHTSLFLIMELRSYNVEKIWSECVKCSIGEDLGVDKQKFQEAIPEIKDMLNQVKTIGGYAHLCSCNRRMDDEIWTPYLQIAEMLVRMGSKIGCVKYTGKLKPETLIKIVV